MRTENVWTQVANEWCNIRCSNWIEDDLTAAEDISVAILLKRKEKAAETKPFIFARDVEDDCCSPENEKYCESRLMELLEIGIDLIWVERNRRENRSWN